MTLLPSYGVQGKHQRHRMPWRFLLAFVLAEVFGTIVKANRKDFDDDTNFVTKFRHKPN